MLTHLKFRLNRWREWRYQSVNHRIFAAAFLVGSMTFIVKLIAVIKEQAVANWFGTSDAVDAYLTAYLLATFSVTIIAESFNVAFMPTFIEVRERDGLAAAKRLFSNATILAIFLLTMTTFILALTAPYTLKTLGSGFDAEKQDLTRNLYYVMLPILLLRGLSCIWGALLNADERFALSSISPLAVPLITLIVLLAFGTSMSVSSLAVGSVLGFGVETILLGYEVHRQHYPLIPHWTGIDTALRQVIGQYGPMIAGSFIMSGTLLVDQAMAGALGSGSVASLSYGNRIVSVVLVIGSTALGTAVLPHFSRMLALEDWQGVRRTYKFYATLIIAITIPSTLLLIALSKPMTQLLYQRGAFTPEDTALVSRIQIFYLLQIPFYILSILTVRLISALKANYILLRGTIINIIVNIVLNIVAVHWLGIAGIALSTTGVYLVSLVYVFYELSREMKKRTPLPPLASV